MIIGILGREEKKDGGIWAHGLLSANPTPERKIHFNLIKEINKIWEKQNELKLIK